LIESEYLKDSEKFIEKLRQIPTLTSFDEKNLKGLLSLSKIRQYEPGEYILEEGSYDTWIYFLVSGKVQVSKKGKDLSVLKRTGDIFGEMGVIDGSARSASVRTLEKTVCLATDASYADRLTGEDKFSFCYILFRVFAEILANRLRATSEELVTAKEEVARLEGKR
jgi:CRP/FNR family transcriptional regulator, cyclic AMP receptor protein